MCGASACGRVRTVVQLRAVTLYFIFLLCIICVLGERTSTGGGHKCYLCANSGREMDATLRRRLGAQRDVFYWPLEARSDRCHTDQREQNYQPLFQICDRPHCVTLTPNKPNVTFTVRGCLEQVLRRPLMQNPKLRSAANHQRCFLVRSKPIYSDELGAPLDYQLCVCGADNAGCNAERQPAFVPIGLLETSNGQSVVELRMDNGHRRLPKDGLSNRSAAIYEPVVVGGVSAGASTTMVVGATVFVLLLFVVLFC